MAGRQTGGRLRAVLFLMVSLAAAGVAVAVIWSVITSYQRELVDATREEETVQVVVAGHDLAQGRTITAEDLKPIELPPDYVPNAVLREAAQAIGRVPRERILGQEFIREERLADPEAGVGLNAIIPRGMRAISVNLKGGSAVSGFLNPGNYVDVLVTVKGDSSTNGKTETNTLLQAITVLAVDNRMGVGSEGPVTAQKGKGAPKKVKVAPSVTLAVTPEQAEQLTHAVAESDVVLTLRNDIDVTHIETNGAFTEELLGGVQDDKRIPVTEWKKHSEARSDGSIIMIRGTKEAREDVK